MADRSVSLCQIRPSFSSFFCVLLSEMQMEMRLGPPLYSCTHVSVSELRFSSCRKESLACHFHTSLLHPLSFPGAGVTWSITDPSLLSLPFCPQLKFRLLWLCTVAVFPRAVLGPLYSQVEAVTPAWRLLEKVRWRDRPGDSITSNGLQMSQQPLWGLGTEMGHSTWQSHRQGQ